jgi:hypothetical protein
MRPATNSHRYCRAACRYCLTITILPSSNSGKITTDPGCEMTSLVARNPSGSTILSRLTPNTFPRYTTLLRTIFSFFSAIALPSQYPLLRRPPNLPSNGTPSLYRPPSAAVPSHTECRATRAENCSESQAKRETRVVAGLRDPRLSSVSCLPIPKNLSSRAESEARNLLSLLSRSVSSVSSVVNPTFFHTVTL